MSKDKLKLWVDKNWPEHDPYGDQFCPMAVFPEPEYGKSCSCSEQYKQARREILGIIEASDE